MKQIVKKTKFITVKNGAQIEVIDAPISELMHLSNVVYLIVHRASKKVYVGLTQMTLKLRWYVGYDNGHQAIGYAIEKHGEDAFDKYVVAKNFRTRKSMCSFERKLITLCGGHKSNWTYNLTGGGDVVSDLSVPIIGVNLMTGKEREFKSASDAGRLLGAEFSYICAIANGFGKSARDKNKDSWWFHWKHDTVSKPPSHFGHGSGSRERYLAIEGFNLITGESRGFLGYPEIHEILGIHPSKACQIIKKKRKSASDKIGNSWWFRESGDKTKPPEVWGPSSSGASSARALIVIPFADRRKRLYFDSVREARDALGSKSGLDAVARGEMKSFCVNGEHYWATYDIKNIHKMPKDGEYGKQMSSGLRQRPVLATHTKSGSERLFTGLGAAGKKFGVDHIRIWKAINYDRLIGNYRFAYA